MVGRAAALWAVVGLGLLGCGTVTTVPLVWKDPAWAGDGYARIFVIGVAENPATRRVFEDELVAALRGRGTSAVASYTTLPDTERLGEERIRKAMAAGDFDAVVITRLLGSEERPTYVPPRTYTVPSTYGGYYGYYHRSWDVVHEPGYTRIDTVVRLETNLYDVATAALVWSAQSETLDPRSIGDGIASVTSAVAKQLAEDEVIR